MMFGIPGLEHKRTQINTSTLKKFVICEINFETVKCLCYYFLQVFILTPYTHRTELTFTDQRVHKLVFY